MWIYDYSPVVDEVDYESPRYTKGTAILPEDIFDKLIDEIYVEEIIAVDIDGENALFYSQAVPSDTNGDRS